MVDLRIVLKRNATKRILVQGPGSFQAIDGVAAGNAVGEVKKWEIPEGTTYEIFFHDLQLLLKKYVPSSQLYHHHEKMLSSSSAKYYIYTPDVVICDIRENTRQYLSHPLWSGSHLPSKIFTVFYTDKRLDGDLEESATRFVKPEKLNSILLKLNGRVLNNFMSHGVSDFSNGQLEHIYMNLFKTLEGYYTNKIPDISFDRFCMNCFIFSADLTAGCMVPEGALPLNKTGDLRFSLSFNEGTPSLKMLTFGIKPSLLQISGEAKKGRIVTLSKWE